MEAMVVGVGKSLLMGALGYGRSKAGEEAALQLGVEDDSAFIDAELEMMQSFLMMADEEKSQNKVVITWVKHVRDLAYIAEGSLMDFSLLSEKKSWWRSPRTMVERRRIAMEMKNLRAKVEDVSDRNLRYRHIDDSSASTPTVAKEQASIATVEARFAALGHEHSAEVDLHQLITSDNKDLRVIAMWATSSDLGKMSAISEVYDDPMVLKRFGFCAWIRLMHPFNPQEFLRSLVRQFYENSHDEVEKAEQETSVGANVLDMMEKMDQSDLVHVFNAQLCSNSYLIVIDDLSTIVEWHCIRKYFPNNKKQSRIIVSTQQAEIASLCTEKPYQISEFRQLSCDQTIYLFHKKITEGQVSMDSIRVAIFDKKKLREEDQEPNRKKFDRSRTMALADDVLCGRETERSIVIKLVGQPDTTQTYKVISVWGMGGLGKTTLVRSIYDSQQLGRWKCAWATALRPFNPEILLRDLALQLHQDDPAGSASTGAQKKSILVMNLQELKEELARVLKVKMCLVVLDDISSTSEWELVKSCLVNAARIIVITREIYIAEYCSREYNNIFHLGGLKEDAALDLFTKKVFL